MMIAALFMGYMRKKRMIKEDLEKLSKNYECCRTCLARDGLQPIFTDDTDSQPISLMNLSQYIQIASGIKMAKDDGLPQVICTNCIKLMHEVIKFKKLCKKTENTLRTFKNKPTVIAIPSVTFESQNPEGKLSKVKKKGSIIKKNVLEQCDNKYDSDNDFYCDDITDNKLTVNVNKLKVNVNKRYTIRKRKIIPNPISLKCEVCGRVMKNKNTYMRHMMVHNGDYPYMCEQCGKGIMAYTHLVNHMKANHGWERTDKCSFCGYLALDKFILQIHERTHTGEKPYICDHCGSGFHRRANLLQHLPIHSEVKSVQCSLCPAKFKSVRFLRTHRNKAHKPGKYAFLCGICKNYFKTCYNVRLHMTRIHSIPKEDQGPVTRVLISDAYKNSLGTLGN